jgi:hypothetical protein
MAEHLTVINCSTSKIHAKLHRTIHPVAQSVDRLGENNIAQAAFTVTTLRRAVHDGEERLPCRFDRMAGIKIQQLA